MQESKVIVSRSSDTKTEDGADCGSKGQQRKTLPITRSQSVTPVIVPRMGRANIITILWCILNDLVLSVVEPWYVYAGVFIYRRIDK